MKITIEEDLCLGFSHCGSVWTTAQGEFEMPDDYVETLVALIREKGTADIEELELEESHPEIYEFLNESLNEIYQHAEEAHFIREGFSMDECYEYSDELIDYCEKECGFVYPDEDYIDEFDFSDEDEEDEEDYEYERRSHFESWICNYAKNLDDDEIIDFFYEHINNGFDYDPCEFEISIPQQIIDMAGIEEEYEEDEE
jgi:hypothetical protein